jgi:hypothetical protein
MLHPDPTDAPNSDGSIPISEVMTIGTQPPGSSGTSITLLMFADPCLCDGRSRLAYLSTFAASHWRSA